MDTSETQTEAASPSGKQVRSLQCGARSLSLEYPQIMGVLNITPDSFSDGGSVHSGGFLDMSKVLYRAEAMLSDGATIIDVGGESTRPGASAVSLTEESDRVLPVVAAIAERLDVIISVDTSRPEIMREAVSFGAGLLNDVRALTRPGAIEAAHATGVPVCLMHMQGQPDSMQQSPTYSDVVVEVNDFLLARALACQQIGIAPSQIVLDPGFGFGKSVTHNLMLLNRLAQVVDLGFPVLVGLSRKSLIGKVLNREVDQRMAGSLALALLAAERGASIIRVHDVAETADCLALLKAVQQEQADV